MKDSSKPVKGRETNSLDTTTNTNCHDPIKERLQALLTDLRRSEPYKRRALISDTFRVNDVIAEYSLRHLESSMQKDTSLQADIEQYLSPARTLQPPDYRAMLGRVFGIHGPAAAGVLANLDRARRKKDHQS